MFPGPNLAGGGPHRLEVLRIAVSGDRSERRRALSVTCPGSPLATAAGGVTITLDSIIYSDFCIVSSISAGNFPDQIPAKSLHYTFRLVADQLVHYVAGIAPSVLREPLNQLGKVLRDRQHRFN